VIASARVGNEGSLTVDYTTAGLEEASRRAVPGALIVFSPQGATHAVLRTEGGGVALERDRFEALGAPDPRISRRHALCRWEHGIWVIRDLDSRNGTWVNGRPIDAETRAGASAVVRVGDTLVVLLSDVSPHESRPLRTEAGVVAGAALQGILEQVRRASAGSNLHLTGPSGAGKELAARAFHAASARPDGPFVAINCAAIPEGVAERLLFGARKGAFSGAHADVLGHIQEADGGTLFLDEVGELDLEVQAKLLRVLETREVIALGSSRPKIVDFRLCSATHSDLRTRVANRRFREDLYFRIAHPTLTVPPLHTRVEEIPFLVERACRAAQRTPHVSLVEACLLRPWPGNARELLAEVTASAHVHADAGRAPVRAAALSPTAGSSFAPVPPEAPTANARPAARDPNSSPFPPKERIEAALHRHAGRVAAAARDLSVHRNQLRRWLTKQGIDPKHFAGE